MIQTELTVQSVHQTEPSTFYSTDMGQVNEFYKNTEDWKSFIPGLCKLGYHTPEFQKCIYGFEEHKTGGREAYSEAVDTYERYLGKGPVATGVEPDEVRISKRKSPKWLLGF